MQKNFSQLTKVLARLLNLSAEELLNNFKPANVDKLDEITELRHRGFGGVRENDAEIIRWRYFSHLEGNSNIFVLTHNGAIIAAVGAEPISVRVGNSIHNGVRTADIVVEPKYMKLGIGAWMNMYMQHHHPIVMAMGANENSSSMVRRIFKPMKCRYYMKFLLSMDAYLSVRTKSKFLVGILSVLAWLPLSIYRLFYLSGFSHHFTVEVNESCKGIEAYLDAKSTYRNSNKVIRDSKFYKWRYDKNPLSKFKYLTVRKKGDIVGVCVVRVAKKSESNEWLVMDWKLLEEFQTQEMLGKLFSLAVKYSKDQGASSISLMLADNFSKDVASSVGFSERDSDDGFYLYTDESVDEKAMLESCWYLSYADTDEAL